MTNVDPAQLNYDKYTSDKYDQDIVNSIPYHRELHEKIVEVVSKNFDSKQRYNILDLGVGTGITSKMIQDILPNASFDVVDFSEQMLEGAKKKLGEDVNYILGDYSKIEFEVKYDLVISVIGLHHQNNEGKQAMFRKIFGALKLGGVFVFGDLVTYRDEHKAALNNAKHFHHLVEKAVDEETLKEWAYHHQFLNDLAPVEDQIEWLKDVGFNVQTDLLEMNTALLVCKK